jgi:hypothetical protein
LLVERIEKGEIEGAKRLKKKSLQSKFAAKRTLSVPPPASL